MEKVLNQCRCVCVLTHELGHFIALKALGYRVIEFKVKLPREDDGYMIWDGYVRHEAIGSKVELLLVAAAGPLSDLALAIFMSVMTMSYVIKLSTVTSFQQGILFLSIASVFFIWAVNYWSVIFIVNNDPGSDRNTILETLKELELMS